MAQIDPATPPSLSFTGKTALVTTLIAIALNPISIIIGYYLSQSLQAPKLEINYVEPEYVLEPLRPSPALLQAWNKYPFFRDYIYQDLVYVGPSCRGWISDSVVRSSCINEIVGIAKQIRDRNKFSKEVAQNEINRITNSPSTQHFTISINLTAYPAAQTCNSGDKASCLQELNNILSDCDDLVDVSEKFVAAAEDVNRLPISRTGRVIFHVGILNQGDADSVIPPDAELTTEGKSLVLRRAVNVTASALPGVIQYQGAPDGAENSSWSPRRFTPVKGRGFSEVLFEIDEGMSIGANKDNFLATIKNKSHSEFTLTIKTPDKVLSKKGDFSG